MGATDGPVLFLNSGIGGLSVVKEARILLPDRQYVYVADDAAFPYGAWQEEALRSRLVDLFGDLIARFSPSLSVIACNTASTIAISALREAFPRELFVGTVPAIKPAAERTRSGMVSVLATPGTVKRQYTRDLISTYASRCHVRLVGSENLATLAEQYMREGFVDEAAVAEGDRALLCRAGGKAHRYRGACLYALSLSRQSHAQDGAVACRLDRHLGSHRPARAFACRPVPRSRSGEAGAGHGGLYVGAAERRRAAPHARFRLRKRLKGVRNRRRASTFPVHTKGTFMDLLRILLAILLPPLGVFMQVGIGKQFWINILLTLLGYIPGIVHAVWVIAKY